MKKYVVLIVVLAALVGFSACKKEKNGKVLFKATIESPTQQGKTSIADDGTMTWRSGDRITVFYGELATVMDGKSLLSTTSTGRTAEFTLVPNMGNEPTGGHYHAFYPANFAGFYYNTINLPYRQDYRAAVGGKVQFEAPMYAYSENDQFEFKNLCGVVRLTITTPKTIEFIGVKANEPLCGEFTVDWHGGKPTMTAVDPTEGTEVVFCCNLPYGVDCTNGADFYLYLPVNETGYTGLEFDFQAEDGSHCFKTLQSDQHYIVGRNTLNPLVFSNLAFRPVATKGGLFTINEEGAQVWFSQGNLQYQAQEGSGFWRFADNQYDYVGNDNGNIGEDSYGDWIDLFGWGTGNNPTLASSTEADYGTFSEWGSNSILNGGSGWRTLSSDEWDYIFNERTTNSSLGTYARYAKGEVDGVHGVILFPDGYIHPTDVDAPQDINDDGNTGWLLNSYNPGDWAKMEAAGAVFLPAAGYRNETTVFDVEFSGNYWSSTSIFEYMEGFAKRVYFLRDNLSVNGASCINGYSVRLVRDNN